MALVSMKREEDEAYEPMPPPAFPYGLRLCLCHEEIEKLGLESLPAVRSVVDVQAKAVVVSVTDDEGVQRLEMQITDLSLKPRGTTAAAVLYDKD
jgi:hypothetical protein